MDGSPRLQLAPTTELRTSLLSFLSLLHLGALALDDHIAAAVEANPALEREPGGFCPRCGQYAVAGRCRVCRRTTPTTAMTELAATPDWRAELVAAARLEAGSALHPALAEVVASLDDRGLLTTVPSLPTSVVDAAVAVLREVGPPGIAATSAVDCVLVQVRALVAAGVVPDFAPRLFADHLADVGAGRVDEVAVALGVSSEDVRDVLAAVRARTTPYVPLTGDGLTPPTDVVFRTDDTGGLRAVIVGLQGYGLTVARDLGDGSHEAATWLRPHLREAQRLVDALAARSVMLQRVADVLAAEQASWILHGREHRPLRRSEVARELGVHPSTVGRAVTDKTARLPDGRTVGLDRFFGATQSQLDRVAEAVRAHPDATDAELAGHLAAAGAPLARRTVAKYRAQLRRVPKPASPSD